MAHGTTVFSLVQTQDLIPDEQHYDSTVEYVELHTEFGDDDRIWSMEAVPVHQIDEMQLIQPLEWDEDSSGKVESLRQAFRSGTFLPPVYLLHYANSESPYFLIEGRHRYNAAYLEKREAISAWVGHIDCDCLSHAIASPPSGDATTAEQRNERD